MSRFLLAAVLVFAPMPAYAQRVPVWLAVLTISPVIVISLAILLGFVARSWRIAMLHASLAVLWVVLFVTASRTVENDYLIWTPVLLYGAHAALIVVLVVVGIARRERKGGM